MTPEQQALPTEAPEHADPPAAPALEQRIIQFFRGWPGFILAVAAIVGATALFVVHLVGGGRTDGPSAAGAKDVCHQFVERRLVAPATARYTEETVGSSGEQWTVNGQVDADNRFGAPIRMSFTCVVEPRGGGDWYLISLTGLSG